MLRVLGQGPLSWDQPHALKQSVAFFCGYCNHKVGADKGYLANAGGSPTQLACIAICPHCNKPTYFFAGQEQVPAPAYGEPVEHLPEDVARLYDEARKAMSQQAWTAAVLVGRRLLMNVAATHGADGGLSFVQYVDYLVEKGYITRNMVEWVDQIRKLANEATHELPAVTQERAETLMTFLAMLLKVVFEYPTRAAQAGGAA